MKKILEKKEMANLKNSINDSCKFKECGLNMLEKLAGTLEKSTEDKKLSNKGLIEGLHKEIDTLREMINLLEFTADKKEQFVLRIGEINDKMARNNIVQTATVVIITSTLVAGVVTVVNNALKRRC